MKDLIAFQRNLLYIITGLENPHGLAIADELAEYYNTEIQHSRLYPNLDTLVDKGLVQKEQEDGRTNSYSLTGQGRRELNARREWEDHYLTSLLSSP